MTEVDKPSGSQIQGAGVAGQGAGTIQSVEHGRGALGIERLVAAQLGGDRLVGARVGTDTGTTSETITVNNVNPPVWVTGPSPVNESQTLRTYAFDTMYRDRVWPYAGRGLLFSG